MSMSRLLGWAGMVACAVLLSLMSVFVQVKTRGLGWHEQHAPARMEAVLVGDADSPQQYRVLMPLLTVGAYKAAGALGVPRPVGATFLFIRLAENTALFLAAIAYYRRLGIRPYLGLLGISALAWATTHMNRAPDLGFDVYLNATLFVLAAWAVAAGWQGWVVVLTGIGAFNHETAVLMPLLALAVAWKSKFIGQGAPGFRRGGIPSVLILVMSCVVYMIAFVRLYFLWGSRPWEMNPERPNPGLGLLLANLQSADVWLQVALAGGIVPLIAFAGWNYWPHLLRGFCLFLIPIWILQAFFYGDGADVRWMLVPLALVFVPGALCAIEGVLARSATARQAEALA